MIGFPAQLTDPLILADWMELIALISSDRNSSYGDLSSALRRISAYEEFNDDELQDYKMTEDEKIEEMCAQVFSQFHQRHSSSRDGYPFVFNGTVLKLKANSSWEDYVPYVFCLFLSYFGPPPVGNLNRPRVLFEELSKHTAKEFISGDARRFGAPRYDLPSSFSEAINELCDLLGEGEGYRVRGPSKIRPQDDRLDIVAWRSFPDKLPGKLIIFGQCASNKDWEGWRAKLTELQPEDFCKQWMVTTPSHSPVKAFFVPHCVDEEKWEYSTRYSGILFDRCRISFWARDLEQYQEQANYIRDDYFPWLSKLGAGQ